MKSITSFVIALFVVGAGIAEPNAAMLRATVTVENDVIRLSDLFTDAEKGRDTIIAAAPAPGHRITFNATKLHAIARRTGLSWRPQNRYQHAVVTRSGSIISALEIETRIHKAMTMAGFPPDQNISLSKSDLAIHVAAGENRAIRVVNPRYNVAGKQFSAILEVPRGRNGSERIQVTGNIFETVEVPVLARRVPRGETIRDSDVELVKMRRDGVGQNSVLDKSRIIGKTPKRLLKVGKPLRITDLQAPVLVEKGRLVTLVLRNEHMLITAQGRALENGGEGDVIRVTNTRSRNTIQGVVIGQNRVTVNFPSATH